MNKQVKRSYITEFRENAVNLVISSDKQTVSIAKELGINPTTLYSWVNKARDTTLVTTDLTIFIQYTTSFMTSRLMIT